jgi:dTDP-4-amino-4,6-dideoxygalactose transaminase
MWRDHGSSKKYEHQFSGHNMRMEGLQGGILAVKLKYLDRWNEQRRETAAYYTKALAKTSLILPTEMEYGRHVYHLYVVQSHDRDGLRQQLNDIGVESGLHYPIPLHLQEAYRYLSYSKGDFPVTERVKDRILSLPMYPGMQTAAIDFMAGAFEEICNVA